MGFPLVSVIVPFYNAEKTIGKCIQSILSQNFKDFELIFLNDGSTDDTEIVCKSFNDDRIKYFYHDNIGVSLTRQKGLLISKGKYITFIDSDDTVRSDYLKIMVKEMENNDYDIICCNSSDSIKYDTDIYHKDMIITDISSVYKDYFSQKRYAFCIWGKLFKRNLLADISFPDMSYAEDTFVIHQYFKKCRNIRLLSYAGYIYRDNPEGIMHNENDSQAEELLKCNLFICGECIGKFPELKETAEQKLISNMFYALLRLSFNRKTSINNGFELLDKHILNRKLKGRILIMYKKHPEFTIKFLKKFYHKKK